MMGEARSRHGLAEARARGGRRAGGRGRLCVGVCFPVRLANLGRGTPTHIHQAQSPSE